MSRGFLCFGTMTKDGFIYQLAAAVKDISAVDGRLRVKAFLDNIQTGALRGQAALQSEDGRTVFMGTAVHDYGVKLPGSQWDIQVDFDLHTMSVREHVQAGPADGG